MKKRIIGILYMIPMLIAFFVGGIALKILVLGLSVLGIRELHNALKQKGVNSVSWVGILLCLFLFCYNVFDFSGVLIKIVLIVAFFISALLVVMRKHTIVDVAVTWFCIIYAIWPFQEFVRLYELELYGKQLSALIFIIAFASDTFAYLIGCKLGKHKLIPEISPNKTVEGSIGGIFGAILVTVLYCYICDFNSLIFVPIAAIGSIVSQVGDLFASSIKRYCEIKDFGNLIPGHGGVLDRFDSVLFVSLLMSVVPSLGIC